MTQLSPVCNVFGLLHSSVALSPVAAALCSGLGLTPDQVWIKRSSFDGTEPLIVATESCALERLPTAPSGVWLFNGQVDGTPEESYETLRPIVHRLGSAGCEATFEIYDAAYRL